MLTELPAGIGQLSRLERLSAAHNSLAALPASLGQLQKLQVSRLQLQADGAAATGSVPAGASLSQLLRLQVSKLQQSEPRGLEGQMMPLMSS